MNAVFIVPTGVGAEIGGHSGDATPAAKLIASVCDNLFIHPNVVNASDINEMTDNMLYIEGSMLDRFLQGDICLEKSVCNKILVVVNKPVKNETINAVSAARATLGADIEILELNSPIIMEAYLKNEKATGNIQGVGEAIEQLRNYKFDVLVVNTPIKTNDEDVLKYLKAEGGTNIWGGVEAQLSKLMSQILNKPVIHSPIENSEVFKNFNDVVDPRKSAEMVSVCYLHCCLKGGHVHPKMSGSKNAYIVNDIDFLISPMGLWGPPHKACERMKIPIIFVLENDTIENKKAPEDCYFVTNYLEAAGIIAAKNAGVTINSVLRPLEKTKVIKQLFEKQLALK